jgi:hypothetical protein
VREIVRIGQRDLRGGRSRDDAVEGGVVKVPGDEEGAAHLVEMGHERPDRRDKGVGVHDLHGVDAAGVAIDQVGARERQFPVARLPAAGSVGVGGEDAALVEEGVLTGAIKAAHAADGVGDIGVGRIGGVVAGGGGRAGIVGIHDQDVRGIDVGTVIPDVRDDHAAEGPGEVDTDAAGGVVSGIESRDHGVGRHLA